MTITDHEGRFLAEVPPRFPKVIVPASTLSIPFFRPVKITPATALDPSEAVVEVIYLDILREPYGASGTRISGYRCQDAKSTTLLKEWLGRAETHPIDVLTNSGTIP
jgi:hypothetical protein